MLYASNSLDNAPEIFREDHHASAAHQVEHTETNARSATVAGSGRSVIQRSFERFFPTRFGPIAHSQSTGSLALLPFSTRRW
jgi:hypothetical protein